MKKKIIFFSLIFFIAFFSCLKEQPTCFDDKKNGDETDIDCGGDCPLKCDTTTVVVPPFNNPCVSSSTTNSMKVNSSTTLLPYSDCYYTSPYYYLLRSSTSSLTGSSYYIMVHFYGTPPSYARTFSATGSSTYPANNSQVRVRAKIAGTWYYPSGTVYFDPSQGTYATFMCNITVSGYSLNFEVNCN